MTKKLLVCLLALCLLCALSVSAFAAELENGTGDVNVAVDSNNNGIPDDIDPDFVPVYHVIVSWEEMDFQFVGEWDTEAATYVGDWEDKEQSFNVENRSNASIKVSAAIDTATKNGVTATLSANAAAGVTLSSAATEGAVVDGKGPNADFTVTVSGEPTVSKFKVGTITVTFAK